MDVLPNAHGVSRNIQASKRESMMPQLANGKALCAKFPKVKFLVTVAQLHVAPFSPKFQKVGQVLYDKKPSASPLPGTKWMTWLGSEPSKSA